MKRSVDATHLTACIEARLKKEQLVGCTVAVVTSDGSLYQEAFGFRDQATRSDMTLATAFRIASVTKTFTGIALMQLAEQGQVNLDRPVTEYLRTYRWKGPRGSRTATLRELLTHTSGVGEVLHWSDLLTSGNTLIRPGRPRRTLAELYRGEIRAEVAPGVKWAYSNHAFATLGQVIEDVSGLIYPDYLSEHLLGPARMRHTGVERGAFGTQLSTGYTPRARKSPKPVAWLEISVAPAGALISTISDMAAYTHAILSDLNRGTGLLLGQDALRSMLTSQWPSGNCFSSQGLAFLLGEFKGQRLVWHDGGAPGFTSSLLLLPESDLGVVVLSNTLSAGARSVAEAVLSFLIPEDRQQEQFEPRRELNRQFVGTYAPRPGAKTNIRFWLQFGPELVIEERATGLFLSAFAPAFRKGVALHPINATRSGYRGEVQEQGSVRNAPIYLSFQQDDSGQVNTILGQCDLPFQVDRLPAWRSLKRLTLAMTAGLGLLGFFFMVSRMLH